MTVHPSLCCGSAERDFMQHEGHLTLLNKYPSAMLTNCSKAPRHPEVGEPGSSSAACTKFVWSTFLCSDTFSSFISTITTSIYYIKFLNLKHFWLQCVTRILNCALAMIAPYGWPQNVVSLDQNTSRDGKGEQQCVWEVVLGSIRS